MLKESKQNKKGEVYEDSSKGTLYHQVIVNKLHRKNVVGRWSVGGR